MDGTTVLIVEDDPNGRALLALHLSRAGFRTVAVATAAEAWEARRAADVVVLDRMLPDRSGDDWLAALRADPDVSGVPVLMLTARAAEVDRVSGLEGGADDYLVKPYAPPELVARMRALLRRAAPRRLVRAGDLEVDLDAGVARRAGSALPLTRREYALLAFLASHPGRVFDREGLLDRVWGASFVGTDRTVDQHVVQLRRQLGAERIVTVRGLGYRFDADA